MTRPPADRALLVRAAFVERFAAALQERTLGGLISMDGAAWRLLWLETGTARGQAGPAHLALSGPSVTWLPWPHGAQLRAGAGAAGATVLISDRVLANAIGYKPESAELRLMARSRVDLDLRVHPGLAPLIANAFAIMQQEQSQKAAGAEMVVEAQIRTLLVLLWRHVATPGDPHRPAGAAAQALQAFRQLVETHFRDRWTVARYAAELGMTRDRLHDICARSLGKSPSRLLQERTMVEAEALLARSSRTLDQIADHLGFRSAPHFSRFFKAVSGIPPGAFRRAEIDRAAAGGARPDRSYADWP